ncbi:MAG: SUMF1/EgtB/PvdO family nonheme iron enzyme [Nitrospirales bacterium]|nr:SUMF1/EgtB/PvdO family nonheme iron enzyme [Nitrospira sp.]MDR4500668.1 SUMF1/EgtB/PvdO family nonheme iron enzyme [Nitrospirales bacterium]
MDPVTLIVGAIMAAAAVVGSELVKDGYEALKSKLFEKDSQENDLQKALLAVEKKPESTARKELLKEELETLSIHEADPVIPLAKELLEVLKNEGHLAQEKYQAILQGSGVIAQGPGSVAVGKGGAATTGDNSPVTIIKKQYISPASKAESSTISHLKQYLREVAKETNVLPLSTVSMAFADSGKGESFTLADVYTDLDTTALRHVEREDELRQFLAHMHEKERIPAQETVNQQKHVLMMGDPGSGKSTFAKHTAYLLAQASLAEEPALWLNKLKPWDHGPLLPVWVELRNVAAFGGKDKETSGTRYFFLSYLEHSLAQWGIPEFWNELKKKIRDEKSSILFLLDGLDEVPTDQRQLIVDLVNDVRDHYKQHRYLVTCRPYAYIGQPWRLKQFHEVTLAPFSEKQIDRFVENWYDRLAERQQLPTELARQRRNRLKDASRRQDLRGLAERPLLLTVMAQLHAYKGELPDDRTELYADAVDLLLKRWENRMGQEQGILEHLNVPGLKMSDVEAGLYEVAFRAHSKGGGADTADIDEGDLLKWLRKYLGNDWNKASEFVDYIRERAGLLIRHKTEAYTFPHRTFQEFLSACHLVARPDFPKEAADLLREDASRWKEVFILSCGHAARKKQLGQAIAAVNALCPQGMRQGSSADAEAWRRPAIAGDALLEIGLVGVTREAAGQAVLERVQKSLAAAIGQDSILAAVDRAAAGRTLAKLGDPRIEVLDPLRMAWCEVPAGVFLMGDETQECTIPYDYRISKYPITNAQFQAFVDAGGYRMEAYWPEAIQAGILNSGRIQGRYDDQPRIGLEVFGEPFNLPNHPVVGITWYEALAFTRWLNEEIRKRGELPDSCSVQLPNEPEWEKAARGTDGRTYPWGNGPDPNKANYKDTGINNTSAVGCFPHGASPYGIEDMSGNVWEWTRSVWREEGYPIDQEGWKKQEDLAASQESPRVVRGGSFGFTDFDLRCAVRSSFHPVIRYGDLGFRVVVSPFSEP